MERIIPGIVVAGLIFMPVAAYANVVWPALYLEARLFSWWAITVGLVIEYLFVRKLLSVPPVKAIIATSVANAASAIGGVVLVPLAGIAWEVFPGLLFYHILNIGTFNPITWFATFVMACAVNTVIEGLVYQRGFRLGFRFRSTLLFWFLGANTASVGVAMASLTIYPVYP